MKDSCGQEIVPVKERLSIHTNRHKTIRGYSWGWIEGCSKNICWSNDSSFNHEKASAFVREYNERKKKDEGRCCCGKYIIEEPTKMNGTIHEPLGPKGNFCGPEHAHEIRDLRAEVEKERERSAEAEKQRDEAKEHGEAMDLANSMLLEENKGLRARTTALQKEVEEARKLAEFVCTVRSQYPGSISRHLLLKKCEREARDFLAACPVEKEEG